MEFSIYKNILLTHGETKTKEILLNKLKKRYKDKNIFVMDRKTGYNLDPEMNVTTYSTNFKEAVSKSKASNAKIQKKKVSTKKRKCYN